MNKDHYLKLLKRYLGHINNDEKQDILNEYETHFYSGKQGNLKNRFLMN